MTWIELTQRRTQTAKHWRNSATGQSRFEAALKTPLHYATAGPDSRVYDAEINITPQRVNIAALDGWRVAQNGWHYAIGTQAGLPGDGWVGFGGRQGQHWLKFKLMRVGYLHWPTRNWQDVGGNPIYNRANLSRQTQPLTIGPQGAETSINATSLITWQNIWAGVDIRWRVDGLQLKEEVVLSAATRNNLPLPISNPLETYFGFVFRFDLSDVPRILKNGLAQSTNGDFDDADGLLTLNDASDRLLAFMPIDYAYAGDERVRLRKRLWKDADGNHYLIVGAPVLELSALPSGAIVFDPTFSSQPDESAAQDTYISQNDATGNYGTTTELRSDPSHTTAKRRWLMRWDLSSIPAGATCDSAVQSMYSANTNTGRTADIYVTIPAWTEGGATWNTYDGSNNWPGSAGASTSGTDYEADASPPTITQASTVDGESQVDLTTGNNLTAGRIATQFGGNLELIGGPTGNSQSIYRSSSVSASLRPKLVIEYTEGGGQPVQLRSATVPHLRQWQPRRY